MGRGGVVPMAVGGVGPRAFTASWFLLCCLLQGLQEEKSFGSGCWLLLGSFMGPGCACRREAGVGRGGRVGVEGCGTEAVAGTDMAEDAN